MADMARLKGFTTLRSVNLQLGNEESIVSTKQSKHCSPVCARMYLRTEFGNQLFS